MKKLFIVLFLLVAAVVSQSFGVVVTSNTFNTSWNGTVITTADTYSESDYVVTAGSAYVLYTRGQNTTATAEVRWFLNSAATMVSRESLTAGTLSQVRAPRAKFRVYRTGTSATTVEGLVYGY